MSKTICKEWQQILEELSTRKDLLDLPSKLDNRCRVESCYSDQFIYNILIKWLDVNSKNFLYKKNKDVAAECRLKGNDLFVKRDVVQSLCYYSRAVLLAPTGSQELELAFGNRSAALFELGKFQECLSDIKYAEPDNKYPSPRRVRLMIRKAKCLENMKKFMEASDTYKCGRKIIESCSYEDQKKLARVKHEIDTAICKLNKMSDGNSEVSLDGNEQEFKLITDNFKSKPEFPCASSKLSLKQNDKKGRHVIAKANISAGEVLFLERPYAFVILPSYAYERCQNCCKHISNPLPCKHCSDVGFCSEQCRKDAWNTFHKWECGFGLNLCYMIGIAHLGFRVAIIGLSNPKSEAYQRVVSLQQHINAFETEDLYQYTLTATVLLIYLEKFTKIHESKANRVELLLDIGGLILLHIAQLVCNGHAITDVTMTTELGNERIFNEEQVRVATAIYPSASMMNHSCDPSIINGFKDEILIVRAIKDINKEDEVFNCYGPHFRRMPKEERISSLLQQYMFYCHCEPCSSEEDFIERFRGYLCRSKTCNGTVPLGEMHCTKCSMLISEKSIESVKKARQDLDTAIDMASENDFQKCVELAESALKSFTKYLYKYHINILECKDFLAKMFIALGIYYESYKCIEENITGNKMRFGANSIEVANEIVKLSDIALRIVQISLNDQANQDNIIKFKDTVANVIQYIEEAQKIFRLHYGTINKKYKDLNERMEIFQMVSI